MLFLARSPSPTTPSDRYAICAAIRSLIAYAEGLEDCHIDVAAIEGVQSMYSMVSYLFFITVHLSLFNILLTLYSMFSFYGINSTH